MINFIIFSKSDTIHSINLTNQLIQSIKQINFNVNNDCFKKYRILIVESAINALSTYNVEHIISYDSNNFNYNHAINIAINYCKNNFYDNDWFFILNNDTIIDNNAIIAIDTAYTLNNNIQSFSPCTGFVQKTKVDIAYGTVSRKYITGYCLVFSLSTYDKLKEFDENFDFYFQDDDYGEQLRIHNIINASLKNFKVIHIGSQTQKEDIVKLKQGLITFINKYSYELYRLREYEKYEDQRIVN